MSNLIRHPYHLVEESPWPLLSSLATFFLVTGFVKWFNTGEMDLLFMSFITLNAIIIQWTTDIMLEAELGFHTGIVELGLRWGMLLFIISEVFFFVAIFWAYFHMSLAPSVELGNSWPPAGIDPLDPMGVPLLNTLILVTSGVSITWSHHALLEDKKTEASIALFVTLVLGMTFMYWQKKEYWELPFSMADSVYGSVFFMATGFHGLHVGGVGGTLLQGSLVAMVSDKFTSNHHFGFEASIWYWHFVDVVWLFLYISIYWWGSL